MAINPQMMPPQQGMPMQPPQQPQPGMTPNQGQPGMGQPQQGMQQQPQMAPPPPPPPIQDQVSTKENEIVEQEHLINSKNIAEGMDEKELDDIANDLIKRIIEDERSMDDWVKRNDEYLKLAMQIKEVKTTPWRNAANIKYPLLTIAALQFQARAYPAVVTNKSLVKGKPVGYDPSGEKAKKAERVGKHMTYQLMDQINNWDEDMDKLCLILPIIGSVFKKTYWDDIDQKIKSDLIFPTEVIINYWASSMEDARRITHKMPMFPNTLLERQRAELFLDVELSPPNIKSKSGEQEKRQLSRFQNSDAEDVPYCLYECHTYLDLDDDGYKEPYVVVIEPQNRKILRIAPNYILKDIRKNKEGKIVRIKAKQNFTLFNFIPAPDGGILGMGFGLLLADMNEVVNSSLNQLLDQGSMYTTGGGFLAKGVKLKAGKQSFEPNEWKIVQTSGDDLRKGIVPLPVREPSAVLFQVLQALVAAGKEVIAISEISTGKLPGQNTPATTTISAIEEGMKVFTAIIKRIHRSLKQEFKKIFELNAVYLDGAEYFTVLDVHGNTQGAPEEIKKSDYNFEDVDITVESDPNVASDTLRLMKAQALLELAQTGAVDPVKAGQRILEAMDQPNPQELAPGPPPPDPKVQAIQAKAQIDQQTAQQDAQLKQQEAAMEAKMREQEMAFKEREAQMEFQMKQMELRLMEIESSIKIKTAEQESQMKLRQKEDDHMMKMRHKDEDHARKMKEKSENSDN